MNLLDAKSAAILVFAAATIALFVYLAIRNVFFGYPLPALKGAFLNAKEQAVIASVADALFPPGGAIPLSGTEAGVVDYMDRYIRRADRRQRVLMRLLLQFVEHAPWVFGPRHVRFTRLLPEERTVALHHMAQSRIYFLRVVFLSLRVMLTMGYLANTEVARRIGWIPKTAPFDPAQTCERADPRGREAFA